MKHFCRFLSLLMALCMIFPLSACLGDEADVTTDPPLASAEETTAEETAPLEEETTSLYDQLAAMEPIALLRHSTKKTRNYKSFIKTTEISFEIPDVGKQTKEIIYIKNHDNYSEKLVVDDELQSFVMYSDNIFALYISMIGDMGYSAVVESEEQYKKLEGDGPTRSNPTLFDFSGNENFGDGIVSAGDEGFIVNIDLTDTGKNRLVGNVPGAPESPYTVGRAGIVAWIDCKGDIVSISLEAELILKQLGEETPINFRTYSTLEKVGEDIEITPPDEISIYRFNKFNTFYNFISKLTYNYYRFVNYQNSFSFSNTIRISKSENEKWEELYNHTVYGRYKKDESVEVTHEIYKFNEVAPRETFVYNFADGKVTHTDFDGAATERNDISTDGLYNYVFGGLFGNFIGYYKPDKLLAEKTRYTFTLTDESALEYLKEYLVTLTDIDPKKCEFEFLNQVVAYGSDTQNSEIDYVQIFLEVKIKYEGRQFTLTINDQLNQVF